MYIINLPSLICLFLCRDQYISTEADLHYFLKVAFKPFKEAASALLCVKSVLTMFKLLQLDSIIIDIMIVSIPLLYLY